MVLCGKFSLVLPPTATHFTTLLFWRAVVRMSRGILFSQFGHRGVGINGSGNDTLVSEQPANGFELRSVTQHGGGETMTEARGGISFADW